MTFTSLEKRHAAITRLCTERELDPKLVDALGGGKRWATYRNMVRTRLSNMVKAGLPRSTQALGADKTRSLLDDWFAEGGLQSAYIRDAVPSFQAAIDWSAISTAQPWLADLARYETALWQLRHAEATEQPVVDFTFESQPVVNKATQIIELDFPVYRLEQTEFEQDPKKVLLYRHMLTDKVGYMTLTAFQHALFDQCVEAKIPMTGCVQAAAQAHDLSIDASLLEGVSSFLAELMSRTVVIGSRPTDCQ